MFHYDTLILSGGSTAGIGMLGKLCRLLHDKKFSIQDIKNFAGVSIGAMICYFLVVGYNPLEIFCMLINNGITEFFTQNFSPLSGLIGIGLYPLKKFKQKILDIVGEQKSKLKFKDLSCEKKFLCTAYNLDAKKYVIFSNETTPDMNILDAVILSCAIPFIFEPMIYMNNRYVDGGVINNFPLKETTKNFTCNKILGLICHKNYMTINAPKVWYISDILSLFFAHTIHKIEEQLEETRHEIEIVKVESRLPFYKLQLSQGQMLQMFFEGLINV
jgi:predicted acylesterase/phospholipase RssA